MEDDKQNIVFVYDEKEQKIGVVIGGVQHWAPAKFTKGFIDADSPMATRKEVGQLKSDLKKSKEQVRLLERKLAVFLNAHDEYEAIIYE